MFRSIISTRLTFLSTYPWRSALLVVFVIISFVFNLLWVWGVFWIWWAAASVRAAEVVFLDVVTRTKHPYLFWMMIVCWSLVGVSYFVTEFYPELMEY